jgi:hypothetical protein
VVSRQVAEETQRTQEVSRRVSLEMCRFPTQEIPQELTYRWPQNLTLY